MPIHARLQNKSFYSLFLNISTRYANFFDIFRSVPFTNAIDPNTICKDEDSLTKQNKNVESSVAAECDDISADKEHPSSSACDALDDPIVRATQQKRIECCGGAPKKERKTPNNGNHHGLKMPLAAHCKLKKQIQKPAKASQKSFRDQLLDPNTVFEVQTWDQKEPVQYSCVDPTVWIERPIKRASTNDVIFTRLPRPLLNKMLW